jgi:tRNA pseudouridine(38-40) synthase
LQAEIELALFRSGMIVKSNFGLPHKYSWSSSARTDKGVHACAQVISTKQDLLPNEDWETNSTTNGSIEGARERIQTYLPEDIRVLYVIRVTKNLCQKAERSCPVSVYDPLLFVTS